MSDPTIHFIEGLKHLDLRTQAYNVRAFAGSINASILGLLSADMKLNTPTEESGIDGFNKLLNERHERSLENSEFGMAGVPETQDPATTAGHLKSVLEYVFDGLNFPDDLKAACSDPGSTLDFMIQSNGSVPEKVVESLVPVLELSPDEIRDAIKNQRKRASDMLSQNKDQILDNYHELTPRGGFEHLPPRYQLKIAETIDKRISKVIEFAIESVVRGNLDSANDVHLLKAQQKELGEWITRAQREDPSTIF